MRLVDADKLKEELKVNSLGYQYYILDNAPTVEAIPIEWIKEWLTNRLLYDDSVCGLLEDWRKEKER